MRLATRGNRPRPSIIELLDWFLGVPASLSLFRHWSGANGLDVRSAAVVSRAPELPQEIQKPGSERPEVALNTDSCCSIDWSAIQKLGIRGGSEKDAARGSMGYSRPLAFSGIFDR
jgi:hypothetical protein